MSNAEQARGVQAAAAVTSAPNAFTRRSSNSTTSRTPGTAVHEITEQGSKPAYSPVVVAGIVRAIEAAAVVAVGLLCYYWWLPGSNDFARYFVNTMGISVFALLTFQSVDIYHLQAFREYHQQFLRLAAAWSIVFMTTVVLSQLTGYSDRFSWLWLGAYFASGLLILMIFRGTLLFLVRRWTIEGRFNCRTVVVGGGDRGEALIAALAAQRDSGVHITGVFDDRGDDRSPSAYHGVPKLGKVDDLLEFARHTRVDLVLVVLPITAEERILQMVKKLWVLPLDIRLVAQGNKLQFRPRSYSYIGNVPVFDVFDRPIANWDLVAKWLFDKIIGTLALLCVAPIMLGIALAIKLDSRGPIFFKQQRHGFNKDVFEIYKFRSMYVEHTDAMARNVVKRNDPRVTRIGRFIRKTSLDELPQLFNVVFIGDMSLVGPRPHAVYGTAEGLLYDEAIDGYFARHRVKPGLTGWAQINGWRGATDSNEKIQRRVEHDLHYIENWSILFDFWILAQTPFALLRGENAY